MFFPGEVIIIVYLSLPLFLPLTSSFLTQNNIMVHITTNTSSLAVKDSMSIAMMMEMTIVMSNIMT